MQGSTLSSIKHAAPQRRPHTILAFLKPKEELYQTSKVLRLKMEGNGEVDVFMSVAVRGVHIYAEHYKIYRLLLMITIGKKMYYLGGR